jgi:prevent-host-death family protein
MKTINMREAREKLAELVDQSQEGPIWITRHGKPVAMLLGVEGVVDLDSIVVEPNPQFWEMLEKVRRSKRPRHSDQAVRNRFGLPPVKKTG